MSQKTPYRICVAIFVAVWLNGIIFWFTAVALGGDAVNGKMENGHYYLANHGRLTEVSRGVFTYSRIHSYSVFISIPIGIVASATGYGIKKGRNCGISN